MNLRWMLVGAGLLLACDNSLPLGDPGKDAGATGGIVASTGGSGGGGVGGGLGGVGGNAGNLGLAGWMSNTIPDAGICPDKASCSTPAGTVQNSFSSLAEVYSIFVGKWQFCSDPTVSFPGVPADAIGVEYDAPPDLSSNGNMYYLVQTPDGPVRGQGFAYQLTWNLYPESPTYYQLDMQQNGGFGGTWRYSPCPKELQINQTEGSGTTLLVPF